MSVPFLTFFFSFFSNFMFVGLRVHNIHIYFIDNCNVYNSCMI